MTKVLRIPSERLRGDPVALRKVRAIREWEARSLVETADRIVGECRLAGESFTMGPETVPDA